MPGFGFGFSPVFDSGEGSSVTPPQEVVISSGASNVDGLFHCAVVFDQATTGLALSDFTVVNGTAEYLRTTDNITYVLMVMPDAGGDVEITLPASVVTPNNNASNTLTVTINTAWQFIAHNSTSEMYYDMRELVGLTTYVIAPTDAALIDLSGNGRNLVTVNTPIVSSVVAGITRFQDATDKCLNTGVTGSTIFNKNFSVIINVGGNDGQQASNWDLCGNFDGTNTGLIISITTTGRLQIRYQGFTWLSTSAVFANGVVAPAAFAMHFDFTADTLTVTKDGVAVAGSFTVSNISAVDPTAYACTANFYLASFNNNGTATSNPTGSHLYYFAVTDLQTTETAAIVTYLNNKKAVLELVDTLVNATDLKFPHDVIISRDGTRAYVSGKGHPTLTNVDGSFAIIDLTTPSAVTILGAYEGNGDQMDGETVLELSSTRVIHFVDDAALVFDVSNPASISKLQTVSTLGGVVNGAVMIGSTYIFGANKDGYIDVFSWDGTTLSFVGAYDTDGVLGMLGPHDIDVTTDNEHIIFCSKTVGAQFACIRVLNAGALIPIASWAPTFTPITSSSNPDLTGANRIRFFRSVAGDEIAVLYQLFGGGSTGNNVVAYNINDKSTPVYLDSFDLTLSTQRGCTGTCLYRGKLTIAADDQGLRLLDIGTDPSNIKQIAGYFNSTEFTVGANVDLHDAEIFTVSEQNYCIITAQNGGVAVFKINRW